MKKRLYLAAAAAATAMGLGAQINSPGPDGFIARLAAMYADGNYLGCIDQLTDIDQSALTPDRTMQLRYYRAIATVHTDKKAAALMLSDFLNDYPVSDYTDAVTLALGDCYYGSDYAKALEIYGRVNPRALTPEQRADLYYRSAYSNLMLDRFDRADYFLVRLADSPRYADAARFYRGVIAYRKGDYTSAEKIFQTVDKTKAPGDMTDFYLSQIYYRNGDYNNAMAMAKKMLARKDLNQEFLAETYRVVGESAYELGDDTQAVIYLESYVHEVDHPMPSALYILGMSAYNRGEYDAAIEDLKAVTDCADAMGQSAYLYIGQAYMHKGDYTDAAMAFNRALNMQYDPAVQETAYYNYAVASMQGGKVPFANTVETFTRFLNLYPDSRYADEVQQYIINAYLTDNNYTAALNTINKIASPTDATLAAKQRVLYALGVKSLGASNYMAALDYLEEARSLASHSADIDREVSLALGEAYYGLDEYPQAEAQLRRYLKGKDNNAFNQALAHYDLGYALYAQKKYAEAAKEFALVVDSPVDLQANLLADAYNRLGDCRYGLSDFAGARSAYNDAYASNPSTGDYPLYQKALMLGYQRQYADKIEMLARLSSEFPTSALVPDALLETTESYLQLGNTAKAIDTYRELVDKYPNTAQGRQGYLQMALVMYNTGAHDEAVDAYKQVISRYPTSEEAAQAVEQMKRIAAADGTLREFMAFLNSTQGAPHMDESEIEVLTYENAEKEYHTRGELGKLESFVEEYPESSMRARAMAYLVDGYMAAGDSRAAYEYASALVAQYPDFSMVQNALLVKARIDEQDEQIEEALESWLMLAEKASTPELLLEARMGIIRNARETDDYDLALEAADAVLATSGVSASDIDEAAYTRGLALDYAGDTEGAREAWASVADNHDNEYAVMSAYSLAESYFDDADYEQAEKWADTVTDADADFQYWIARGFILLSDVYAAEGDSYKARQYLEAVRDYYEGSEEDIFEMINERLK